jgi:hypothetical protein
MQQLCSNGQGKNKVSYKTRAAAEKAARKTKSGLALRIYRCPRCFEFHLTSQEQRYKIEPIPRRQSCAESSKTTVGKSLQLRSASKPPRKSSQMRKRRQKLHTGKRWTG